MPDINIFAGTCLRLKQTEGQTDYLTLIDIIKRKRQTNKQTNKQDYQLRDVEKCRKANKRKSNAYFEKRRKTDIVKKGERDRERERLHCRKKRGSYINLIRNNKTLHQIWNK